MRIIYVHARFCDNARNPSGYLLKLVDFRKRITYAQTRLSSCAVRPGPAQFEYALRYFYHNVFLIS